MPVQDVHEKSLDKSAALSGIQVMNAISPLDVIAVLNNASVSFVLVGAYGLSGWIKKPRATEDVDVVVASKHHQKAVRELLKSFNHLEDDDSQVVTRLRDKTTKEVAIDVMKPDLLYREVFKHKETVQSGNETYRVPCLEMAIAMKFAPMISPQRYDATKYQDAHDFIQMVRENQKIDLNKLESLGELVYPGGGTEILEFVRRVQAGEKLEL